MRRAAPFVVALALLGPATACHSPRKAPLAGMPIIDVDDASTALGLPPDRDAARTLRQLEAATQGGDPRAGWVTLHYLIDLFDFARYTADADQRDAARALLFTTLKVAPGKGQATTDSVIDALLLRADTLLSQDRLHAGAAAAKVVLTFERLRPSRPELFAAMRGLKGVARGGGPLAGNAILRLADFCHVAFVDAVHAPTPLRPAILATCLYPLFDADPEPYFAADPAARPPEPSWEDLDQGVHTFYQAIAELKRSRLAQLAPTLEASQDAVVVNSRALLPVRRDPVTLGVPLVAIAAPYEWTPLVMLGDGQKPLAADLPEKLRAALAADTRGRVAVALTEGAPASALLAVAASAHGAGAELLELAVGSAQTVRAPRGDYWYGRAPKDQVMRLGVVPLALDPRSATSVRAGAWDPARAGLGLTLVLSAKTWKLVAPRGVLLEAPSAEAEARLAETLRRVHDAFPDDDGLVIVPDATAQVGGVVRAITAARGAGVRAFALAASAPPSAGKQDLAARVTRRAAVQITVEPAALEGRAPALRQCAQDAVDRAPATRGTLEATLVEPVAGMAPIAKIASGGDAALRRCLGEAVVGEMARQKIARARITIAAK